MRFPAPNLLHNVFQKTNEDDQKNQTIFFRMKRYAICFYFESQQISTQKIKNLKLPADRKWSRPSKLLVQPTARIKLFSLRPNKNQRFHILFSLCTCNWTEYTNSDRLSNNPRRVLCFTSDCTPLPYIWMTNFRNGWGF